VKECHYGHINADMLRKITRPRYLIDSDIMTHIYNANSKQ